MADRAYRMKETPCFAFREGPRTVAASIVVTIEK
ncbi:hypothetical protein X733_12210 [Mesorhizobium sp. L2C067A000]|nr:hypothetical protein X733_12210 [Mesorhizobium sp. L2C067A000]